MNYLIFILIILFYGASGLEISNIIASEIPGESRCFSFSWLGPIPDNELNKNCSSNEYKNIPCIEPFETSLTPPNLTEIWETKKSKFTCILRFGFKCMKYTYIYNNAIVNSSYFCGKIIADTIITDVSGCYTQNVEGHTIEACACQSLPYRIPCNSSSTNTYSVLGIILIAFLQAYLKI